MHDNFQLINQQAFHDGQSHDEKLGPSASVGYVRGFDWRKEPSELVQAMQPRQIDPGNLTDLITNIVQVATGERFGLGLNGNVYLITTANVVQRIGDIGETGGFGLLYRADTDTLYI